MRYSFTGKNVAVTDALKEKISEKIDRIGKLFPGDTHVAVTLGVVKLDHTIEVTISLPKRILRGEVTAQDMYVAIDEVVDVLENQMVRYKNRLRDRSRREISFNDELSIFAKDEAAAEGDEAIQVYKTKRFAVKPMDAEEAIMEMELLGHGFFVFRNGQTDEINVVYKRKKGDYGLIEPEY